MSAIIAGRSRNGTPLFENPCQDCGKVRLSDRRRLGRPCNTCSNKRRSTHGLSEHPLAKKLWNVRARCEQPSATNYKYYGGRGIKVCDQWRDDVEAFVAWAMANGYADGLELDRIDVDGDYSPENCRFIPHAMNSRLRRNARCTEDQAAEVRRELAQGATIRQAADRAGVPYMSAWHIKAGNTWRAAA